MNIDTSKVDRMEIRQRIADHETARAGTAAELAAAEEPFRIRMLLVEDEMKAATKSLRERLVNHDQTEGIYDELYEENDEPEEGYEEDKWPLRCTVSGLVLLDGDDVIGKDGRYVLTAVLPNWPQDLPDIEQDANKDEAA